jgi:hypothetical protein
MPTRADGRWINVPPISRREVRVERWATRAFYASPCRYFIDLPLDMTGSVLNARHDAVDAGHELLEGGAVYATDTHYRGAILVEIHPDRRADPNVVALEGEFLARALPPRGVKLRGELDELVRWSFDLGLQVAGVYVQYEPDGPLVRPTSVFAGLRGEQAITDPTSVTDSKP